MLDLSNNKLYKRSSLFKNMTSLTSVKTSSVVPKINSILSENTILTEIENVIITGDDLKEEVLQVLAKKMKENG